MGPNFSFVLEYPPASPDAARVHYQARLAVETDPSDVHADLTRGHPGIIVLDARSAEAFAACHVPGAVSLPHRTISAETAAALPKDRVLVVYCWGPACNAATKACLKLSALGYRVKEMIGGIEYWRREGYAVEGTQAEVAPLYG
jgi:rhodanese-related sulfurtransferase